VDEQRKSLDDAEQEQGQPDESIARPSTMFDETDEATSAELARIARKKAAILGLAAGGVMSLIIVICAGLIYLLGTS